MTNQVLVGGGGGRDVSDMDVPDDYRCPITYQIMEDPVVALDGHSYERKAIEEWFNRCTRSPMTNQVLVATTVMPNHTLKKLISTFVETYAILQREKHDANAEMRRLKLKVDQYEEEIRDRHRKYADGKLVPLRDTIGRIIDLRKHAELTLSEREIARNVCVFFDLSFECDKDKFDFWFDSSALPDSINDYLISYTSGEHTSVCTGIDIDGHPTGRTTQRGSISIRKFLAADSFQIRLEQLTDDQQTNYWTGKFVLSIDSSRGASTSITVLPSYRGSLSRLLIDYIIPATINKYIFA